MLQDLQNLPVNMIHNYLLCSGFQVIFSCVICPELLIYIQITVQPRRIPAADICDIQTTKRFLRSCFIYAARPYFHGSGTVLKAPGCCQSSISGYCTRVGIF